MSTSSPKTPHNLGARLCEESRQLKKGLTPLIDRGRPELVDEQGFRSIAARTVDGVMMAIGRALRRVTEQDALGWFHDRCSYAYAKQQ